MLNQLIKTRLLVAGELDPQVPAEKQDPPIDIAHERLITGWPAFQRWLKARRAAELTRRRLEAKAEEWNRMGRRNYGGGLLDATELREVNDWFAFPEAEDLGRSPSLVRLVQVSRRQVWLQRGVLAAIPTLIICLLLVFTWSAKTNAAKDAQRLKERNAQLADQFARQGWTNSAGDPSTTLLYLTKALDVLGPDSGPAQRNYRVSIAQLLATCPPLNTSRSSLTGLRTEWIHEGLALAVTGREAVVVDAWTLRALTPPLRHEAVIMHAAFSPDGRRVVTASYDRTAKVWDAATGEPLGEPMRHQDAVKYAGFDCSGTRVLTASNDKTARVWDAATGRPVTPPMTHSDWVNAAWSPDGTKVVTASGDRTARVWSRTDGKTPVPGLAPHRACALRLFQP